MLVWKNVQVRRWLRRRSRVRVGGCSSRYRGDGGVLGGYGPSAGRWCRRAADCLVGKGLRPSRRRRSTRRRRSGWRSTFICTSLCRRGPCTTAQRPTAWSSLPELSPAKESSPGPRCAVKLLSGPCAGTPVTRHERLTATMFASSANDSTSDCRRTSRDNPRPTDRRERTKPPEASR
jgi:hypothetical protein